ncbi:hypothetical protein HYV72_02460 [Candidatus Uhrbacteria bacterium]|nr:hypothetical protein [Candidatus Uhrbacteria bacterium]
MDLVTKLHDNGIQVCIKEDARAVVLSTILVQKIPSEHYLRAIQDAVDMAGGFGEVKRWFVSTFSNSFTATRGLAVLVNTLAGIHGLPVFVFKDELREAIETAIPIDPDYQGEPNIG